jgi:hypothetical protein
LTAFSLTACGGGSSSDYSYDAVVKEESFLNGDMEFGTINDNVAVENVDIEETPVNTEQKLIYTSNIDIETKEYDIAESSIRTTVTKMGGYIENTNSYSYSSSQRNSFYKVRIPVTNYREFLNAVCEVGSVTYQSENIEDVTTQYLDVEARLKSLNEKMERLQILKAEAKDLDQLLRIEDQIGETQYQLENYTSQLNYLQNRVSYCTIEINLNEVEVYTEKPSFFTELIDANKDSLEGFVDFLKGICILFVYLYPYLIVLAFILVFVLYYKKQHRQKKVNEKKVPVPTIKSTEKKDE